MPLPTTLAGTAGYTYNFALGDITFTPNMAVRAGAKAFDTAPIVQGHWETGGGIDLVTFPRGDLLGNQTKYFYANFDPYQGSISFWITPEWAGNDGAEYYVLSLSNAIYIRKRTTNVLSATIGGQTFAGPSTAAWTAGTTYHVVFSWDARNTLDGTNYGRWSVNDTHSYTGTTALTTSAPNATIQVGSDVSLSFYSANALIEGLCISRVPFWDGAYGCPMWFNASGRIDVINAIYAAGAGADPAQIFGSWDCTFFLPTDQTEGALATTGQAWSHPHGSELVPVAFVDDGGLPGTDYAVEFDDVATYIGCGSGATLDDIPAAGADITVAGWFRYDADAVGTAEIIHKSDGLVGGWGIYVAADDNLYLYVDLATTNVGAYRSKNVRDGKWHYFACYYDDTAKSGRVSVDGVWGAASVGAGNYVTDASDNLEIGRLTSVSAFWDGALAWIEISDNDRHTAGTNFVPPRYPYLDGNTVEAWLMDEGTGATAAASVTTPANDGTITSGTWSGIWAVVDTPEIPQSLKFDGSATIVNCGSDASLDDVPNGGTITWDGYVRNAATTANTWTIVEKGDSGANTGWIVYVTSANVLTMLVQLATTDATATIAMPRDNRWHHVAAYYDDTAKRCRVALDGVWGTLGGAGVGAYQSEAASVLMMGRSTTGAVYWNGAFGWQRYSDNDRFSAASLNSFIPPSRNNPPAADGNTVEQWNFVDGAGTTLTAIVTSPANNGTITLGSGYWNNTPDLAIDEPGKQIYDQGYNFGSDGADGIRIPFTLTAAKDYVIRVPLQYSPLAWPRITLYDVTGAASIVDFDAPPLSAVHDGAGGAAAFTSTGEVYPASLIGGVIYNPTDGSSGTITAVGGTNQDTITAALAGGGSNDWQVGEQAYIVPPTGWVFNEPISAHTSANTAYELRITNRNSDGIITLHQAEVLLNLVLNGSMETGAGVPWVPTSWTLGPGVIAGETVQELVTIHSGASALEWVGGDGASDYVNSVGTGQALGAYAALGSWLKVTAGSLSVNSFRYNHHNTLGTRVEVTYSGTPWVHVAAVGRVVLANPSHLIDVYSNGTDGFNDDAYAIALDDVTLTVTPASAANSLEGTGIRVDGLDTCTVPAADHRMKARSGAIRFRVTPRHAIANSEAFGQNFEYLLDLTENANNYLRVYRDNAGGGTLTLEANQNGAGAVTDTDTTAWAADTEVLIKVKNVGSRIDLERDGVVVCQLVGLAGFATDFTAVARFGHDATPEHELDGVISPP